VIQCHMEFVTTSADKESSEESSHKEIAATRSKAFAKKPESFDEILDDFLNM